MTVKFNPLEEFRKHLRVAKPTQLVVTRVNLGAVVFELPADAVGEWESVGEKV